jgi:predicted aconitase
MGVFILTPHFKMVEELVQNNFKTRLPFTVDPRPLDFKNVKLTLVEKIVGKIMYKMQTPYEAQLRKFGLKDENAFSCACYFPEVGNIPKKGDMLAWSESSAVVYANSVLGARCNRNSGGIDMLCNVLGKMPYFDLLTDEGRKAKWIVEVKTTSKPNAQLLGSAIGLKVMEDVPFIKGLDKFLGTELNQDSKDYLKDMGAATASNGAVGLYHVQNLTPEAKELNEKLIRPDAKTYIIDDAELDRVYRAYPNIWLKKDAKPTKVFIGCPHLSLNQIYAWLDKIDASLKRNGRNKVAFPTIFCSAPDVIAKFSKDIPALTRMESMGIKITGICALMYMNNPVSAKKPIITNSNKLRTYTSARFFLDDELNNIICTGIMPKSSILKGGQ